MPSPTALSPGTLRLPPLQPFSFLLCQNFAFTFDFARASAAFPRTENTQSRLSSRPWVLPSRGHPVILVTGSQRTCMRGCAFSQEPNTAAPKSTSAIPETLFLSGIVSRGFAFVFLWFGVFRVSGLICPFTTLGARIFSLFKFSPCSCCICSHSRPPPMPHSPSQDIPHSHMY